DAIALTIGEHADLLLLVRSLEAEPGAVRARVDGRPATELDLVLPVRDLLPDGLPGIERVAALVDIRELHRGPDLERAAVGLGLAGDHAQQRGLACPIRTDDAYDAAARQPEREILEEELVAECPAPVLGQHRSAER